MYDGFIHQFVATGIATERESPAWMDRMGNVVEEKDAYGCMVTHNITDPDYVIYMDEVGGNTLQKGDGRLGDELLLCENGKSPQRKINTKNKHYTVLGITTLSGLPVMCCIFFAGITENPLYELGLDLTVDIIGDHTDDDFFTKTLGKGRHFQEVLLVFSR